MYRLDEIANIVGGQLITSAKDQTVKAICYDTRRIFSGEDQLFVALKSQLNDGHNYIRQALEKGVSLFLISDKEKMIDGAHFILVPDTLIALQQWAIYHRQQTTATVVGITGSNGKTAVKEWLAHLAKSSAKIAKTPASYNSQLGVALSILNSPLDSDLWIIEAGISKQGEMQYLEKMIAPDMVIFTNIGAAHSAGFSSKKEKIAEKLSLAKRAKTIIYRKEHKELDQLLNDQYSEKQLLSWSTKDPTASIYYTTSEAEASTNIKIKYGKQNKVFSVPFTDPIGIENILHGISSMLSLEVQIKEGSLLSLPAIKQRMERQAGWRDCTLFNDSYSLDPSSLKLALEALQSQGSHKNKSLILSAIDEAHYDAAPIYSEIYGLLSSFAFDKFILISQRSDSIPEQLIQMATHHYTSSQEMIEKHPFSIHQSEDIIIKGAKKYGLNEIAQSLNKQHHSTVLEINLKAIEHNLQVFRGIIKDDTKIIAVIKAGAYGSGASEIASFLESQSVDYLAVAYIDEGIALRKMGITTPIMILTPDLGAISLCQRYHLEIQIISITQLKALSNSLSEPLSIHLNVDTGMARNGITAAELDDFVSLYTSDDKLRLRSVFSHLSSADNQEEDEFTLSQMASFDRIIDRLRSKINDDFFIHILNTNGLLRFTNHQYNAVRVGVGLYGVGVNSEIMLEPAHSLKSTLVNIKKLPKASSIGYNRTEITEKDLSVGIVPIGYADGLIRKCGNRRYSVYIEGTPCNIVGNVSMDMITVDLSAIKAAKIGMEVIIFDPLHPIKKLAEAAETIEYEVLSRIAPRVKRVIIRS